MFIQFHVHPLMINNLTSLFASIVIILYTSFVYTITTVHRSSNHNYSLRIQYVFTQGWLNSFWTAVSCTILPFIALHLPLWNLYKCKQVACYCLFTCLFAVFILHFVVVCLLLNPFIVYADVVAIFLFVLWLCKEAYYFCFCSFCFPIS